MSLAEKMLANAKARREKQTWEQQAGALGLDDLARRRRLGGQSILTSKDMPALTAGTIKVLALLRDFAWHPADEIRGVAGNPRAPASEGLRRMRELRKIYEIEKRRVYDTRLWEYRLVGLKK